MITALPTGLMLIAAAMGATAPAGASAHGDSAGLLLGLMAFGLGVFCLLLLVIAVFMAIFVYFAAKMLSANGSFGSAIAASILSMLLDLPLAWLAQIACAMSAPTLSAPAGLLASLAAVAIGVRLTHRCGVLRALAVAVLSWVLLLALVIAIGFVALHFAGPTAIAP